MTYRFILFTGMENFAKVVYREFFQKCNLRQFLATEPPSKMMRNPFYFTLKAFFVLKMFKFLSQFFSQVEKQLDQKDKVNFKIFDVTTQETNNSINMLPNISRSNIKQTVKYGRLIEYNMTKTFLKKSFTKYDAETIPRPLLKNKIDHISGSMV